MTIVVRYVILIKSPVKTGDEHGILAQLGEHLPYKQGVTGSSPVGPIEHKFNTMF